MAQRIILDCDPGIDDALAIAFAHGHPGIELVGITTVAGNVGLAKTTANALAVSEFVGAAGTPVTAGCAGPLLRPALDARHVHGDSGLGGAVLPPATASPAPGHAIDYIVETVGAAPGEITLVATGPLTNIALLLAVHPEVKPRIGRIVIMGGNLGGSPAEFNIGSDPEAARRVLVEEDVERLRVRRGIGTIEKKRRRLTGFEGEFRGRFALAGGKAGMAAQAQRSERAGLESH